MRFFFNNSLSGNFLVQIKRQRFREKKQKEERNKV